MQEFEEMTDRGYHAGSVDHAHSEHNSRKYGYLEVEAYIIHNQKKKVLIL